MVGLMNEPLKRSSLLAVMGLVALIALNLSLIRVNWGVPHPVVFGIGGNQPYPGGGGSQHPYPRGGGIAYYSINATIQFSDGYELFALGLLPLLIIPLFGLFLLTVRARISVRRRVPGERGMFLLVFTLGSVIGLFAALSAIIHAPEVVIAYVEFCAYPVDILIRQMAINWNSGNASDLFFRYGFFPISFIFLLSGPPLAIAYILGRMSNRYTYSIELRA
jgi:hypothetical protein